MTLPRGFNARAEREAVRLRQEMGRRPADPVQVSDLAAHLGVRVVSADRLVDLSHLQDIERLQNYRVDWELSRLSGAAGERLMSRRDIAIVMSRRDIRLVGPGVRRPPLDHRCGGVPVNYLVRATPTQRLTELSATERDALMPGERAAARALIAAGDLVWMWRYPGGTTSVSIWKADDAEVLDKHLLTLPLHPFHDFEITALASHPAFPAPLRAGVAEGAVDVQA